MSMNIVELRDAGYREVLSRQRDIFDRMVDCRRRGEPVGEEYLFLVEHRPVYTIGRHGDRANLTDRRFLESRGVELVETERGGDITFHGPGQLVAYPLVDFGSRRMGVKAYVAMLEEAVIMTLADFGIKGERIDGATGVWIGKGTAGERKICAIGVKCSRYVSMHGLALNVAVDRAWFRAINPCGFVDKGVTSISDELGRRVTVADVAPVLKQHLLSLLTPPVSQEQRVDSMTVSQR